MNGKKLSLFAKTEPRSEVEVVAVPDPATGPERAERARLDLLTGLLSHSAFQNTLVAEFARARAENQRLACLLVNIDYFHAINRRFGYDFGDAVICQIAELIRDHLPRHAHSARFSGEEFSAIWLAESKEGAVSTVEALRAEIANHKFAADGLSTYLSATLGIAVTDSKSRHAGELLAASRLVLQAAKREGRNRVCFWERETPPVASEENDNLINQLQDKFEKLERDMKAMSNAEVRSFVDNLEIPDGLSEDHAEKVALIAATIADEVGLHEDEIDTIISAALLHDIGKLGIDESILSKEGELSASEFEEIKKHPLLGVEFLNNSKFFEKELPLILHHHERYDGKGYPDGLAGDEIPIGARIIGIAETLEGMLAGTTYREAMSIKNAINELKRCAGTQFDPELIKLTIHLLETGRIG